MNYKINTNQTKTNFKSMKTHLNNMIKMTLGYGTSPCGICRLFPIKI
jgi:hypothetical protein